MARSHLLFVCLIAVSVAGCSVSSSGKGEVCQAGAVVSEADCSVSCPSGQTHTVCNPWGTGSYCTVRPGGTCAAAPPASPVPSRRCSYVNEGLEYGCNPDCSNTLAWRWLCDPTLDAECLPTGAACDLDDTPPAPPSAPPPASPPPPPPAPPSVPPPPPGTTAPDRIVYTDPATADPSVGIPYLRDWSGFTWYNVCVWVARLGSTSTHPWTSVDPETVAIEQYGDPTLQSSTPDLPVTGDIRCVAFLLASPAPADFGPRHWYAGRDRPLYTVGQNRADEPFIRTNGAVSVAVVEGGVQSPCPIENVTGASCDPAGGGRVHTVGTGCSTDVCRDPADDFACTD